MANDVKTTFRNSWALYAHPLFSERLVELRDFVRELRESDPHSFYKHPATKLLKCVFKAIMDTVPTDPADKQFLLGNTLGKDHRSWRRVKRQMPARYRLFFKFHSDAPKSIVYVWLNDECTLRKQGAKTDVYRVFEGMIKRGMVPNTYKELLAQAEGLSQEQGG